MESWMAKTDEARQPEQLGAVNKELYEVLTALRQYVDNINKAPSTVLSNGVYRQRNKDDLQKTSWNGWEFGYGVEEYKGYLVRKCFIKCQGFWNELPEKEKDEITLTVMEAMFDKQQDLPVFVPVASDCMCIGQKFQVTYLKEKNPNLVSISNMPIKGNA